MESLHGGCYSAERQNRSHRDCEMIYQLVLRLIFMRNVLHRAKANFFSQSAPEFFKGAAAESLRRDPNISWEVQIISAEVRIKGIVLS